MFTANFKEQVTWRDAATGRIIAQSDFFEPMSAGALITPGIGGRTYFQTGKGFIVLQVMPKPALSSGKYAADHSDPATTARHYADLAPGATKGTARIL